MNNENNNGFQSNQPENGGDMNTNANSAPEMNTGANPNPNPNMDNSSGWVFSERQNQPNNGYNSKYSYSSYENAQTHQQPSYPNNDVQRQNSGPAYDHSYSKQEESYRWNYDDYQSQYQAKAPKKTKKNRGLKIFGCILGGILCVGVLTLAGFGVASLVQSDSKNTVVTETPAPAVTETPAVEHNLTLTDKPEEETEILSNGKLTIPQRAEKVKASVVGIVNYQQSSSMYSMAAGEGSGIIMSEDGYIITNAHVIDGAVGLKVVLTDGEEYSAQIVGSDSKTDLAVIKIEATGLTPAEFGNSDQLQVGEQLIAVGNPTGLELGGTLTVGYVSALNRQIDETSGLNYIQTDAAINPGNSGGALANEYGQVIGINSAKISGEDIEGLGFAISINDAQPIIDDLINYGYVKGRVRMGISGYEMDQFMAAMNNAPQGFIVASIEAGTPAASSGLVPGDVITAIDGQELSAYEDITKALEGKKPGDIIVLSIFRRTQGYADKELTIEIELIESVEKAAQLQDYSSSQSSTEGYNGYTNPYSYFGIQ